MKPINVLGTIVFLLCCAFLMSGCSNGQNTTNTTKENQDLKQNANENNLQNNLKNDKPINNPEQQRKLELTGAIDYSIGHVQKHNNEQDCWIIIGKKIYDVTKFIPSHPGGEALLQGCGTDATELFETRPMGSGTPHSDNARELLNDYFVGDLR